MKIATLDEIKAEILIKLEEVEEDDEEDGVAWAWVNHHGFKLEISYGAWMEPESGGYITWIDDEPYLQMEIS